MNILEVTELSYKYHYDDFFVLKGLSFTVGEGEYKKLELDYGKTTLARLLGGLLQPTEGRIIYKGNDIACLLPQKRNIAVIFEDYALINGTVYDNIAFGLKVRGVQRDVADKTVRETAELFGLSDKLKLRKKALNRMERLLTACARVCTRESELLILDNIYKGMTDKERELAEVAVLKVKNTRHCAVLEISDKGD